MTNSTNLKAKKYATIGEDTFDEQEFALILKILRNITSDLSISDDFQLPFQLNDPLFYIQVFLNYFMPMCVFAIQIL